MFIFQKFDELISAYLFYYTQVEFRCRKLLSASIVKFYTYIDNLYIYLDQFIQTFIFCYKLIIFGFFTFKNIN